ncbi:MAG: DUF4124 domain-containing protein [Xanthomonadales bacterium]|nr:DUF4124 domain-containing protein [Xanthomonadales bacterium]
MSHRSVPSSRCCAAVALAAFLAVPTLAHAQSAWQCRDGKGQVAYQDRPCEGGAHERRIEFAPAPDPEPSPEYRLSSGSHAGAHRSGKPSPSRTAAQSFECRASNGEVFYRHGACPSSIPVRSAGGSRRDAATASVSALPLSRREACRRMQSSGRAGRERDHSFSTYERNLGRDPCR